MLGEAGFHVRAFVLQHRTEKRGEAEEERSQELSSAGVVGPGDPAELLSPAGLQKLGPGAARAFTPRITRATERFPVGTFIQATV